MAARGWACQDRAAHLAPPKEGSAKHAARSDTPRPTSSMESGAAFTRSTPHQLSNATLSPGTGWSCLRLIHRHRHSRLLPRAPASSASDIYHRRERPVEMADASGGLRCPHSFLGPASRAARLPRQGASPNDSAVRRRQNVTTPCRTIASYFILSSMRPLPCPVWLRSCAACASARGKMRPTSVRTLFLDSSSAIRLSSSADPRPELRAFIPCVFAFSSDSCSARTRVSHPPSPGRLRFTLPIRRFFDII